jgi:sortase A
MSKSQAAPRPPLARAMSAVGQTLTTLGVVLVMFVVWEMWWTDVGASHRQDQVVDALGWEHLTLPEVASTPTAAPVPELERHTSAPPVLEEPAIATTFAVLYVPRWGAEYARPVSEGTSRSKVLNTLGIGHYFHTAMPGGLGNFALAAHRTTYGKPFSRVDELQVGDALVVRTEDTWYVYRVTSTAIVAPDYLAAIAPVPGELGAAPTGRYITFTTCHPRYSAEQRFIVHGVLDYWAPANGAFPSELLPAEGGK